MKSIPQRRPIQDPMEFVAPSGEVEEGYTPEQVVSILLAGCDSGITPVIRANAARALVDLLDLPDAERLAALRRDVGDAAVHAMAAEALEARIRMATAQGSA
jgi:hypothetical protein